MSDSIFYCDQCETHVMCHAERNCVLKKIKERDMRNTSGKWNKSMLLHFLKSKGKKLTCETVEPGTCWEYKQYRIDGRPVAQCMKGDRPDWESMASVA